MIKFAGILLTLCATSLVVINIRTLETVETSPDDRPALIDTSDTCLVARWAGYPGKKHDADSAARRGPAPKKTSVGGWRRLSRRLKTPLSPISPAKTSRKNTKHS